MLLFKLIFENLKKGNHKSSNQGSNLQIFTTKLTYFMNCNLELITFFLLFLKVIIITCAYTMCIRGSMWQ